MTEPVDQPPTKAEYRKEAVHQAMLDWMDNHVGRLPSKVESDELRKYLASVHKFAGEAWEMFVGPGNVRVLAEHFREVEIPAGEISREEFESTTWASKEEMLINLARVKKE